MATYLHLEDGYYIRETDGAHVATKHDDTPMHQTYQNGSHQGGYNPACGWCYLNARHSEAAHEQSRMIAHL